MKNWFVLIALIFAISCAGDPGNESNGKVEDQAEENTDVQVQVIDFTGDSVQLINPTMESSEVKQDTSLPIHGDLSQQELQDYYPGIVDSISEIRLFFSEPIAMDVNQGIHVSILHHHGTFDQQFLCTHDSSFNLINSGYIGNSTMFDGTSHSVDFEIVGNVLESSHVDWGYVNDVDIDTINNWNETIEVSKSGEISIVKKD